MNTTQAPARLSDHRENNFRSLTILLVDDNADFRAVMQQLLEQLGHQVVTAPDGVKALRMFEALQQDIDLILLDYMMPGMDGAETLNYFRLVKPSVKVILMSGAEELRLRRIFAEHRIDGQLHKPSSVEDILRALDQVLAPRQ